MEHPKAPAMDLTTLPDEMFSNVMKYAKFGWKMKLRRVNQRTDRVAKRYGLCERIPVKRFTLVVHDVEFANVSFVLDREDERYMLQNSVTSILAYIDKDEFFPSRYFIKGRHPQLIGSMLAKLRIRNSIILEGGRSLRTETFDAMFQNRKYLRNVTELILLSADIQLSEEMTKSLLWEVFPRLKKISLIDGTVDGNFCNVQVLGNRKWDLLELCPRSNETSDRQRRTFLNDKFLSEVVANCQEAKLRFRNTSFTIRGVVNLRKLCIVDGKYERRIDLGFVYGGNLSNTEIREPFLVDFPGIYIKNIPGDLVNDICWTVAFRFRQNDHQLSFTTSNRPRAR